MHAFLEQLVTPLASLLGHVHREVGVAEHLLRGRGRRVEGDADAGVHLDLLALDREGPVEGVEHASRHRLWRLGCRVLEQDRELVSTQPRGRVGRPQGTAETVPDGDEQLVAGAVPEAVVDRLEVVEIQEEDRQREVAQPAGPIERVLDPIGEERPVGEPGQRIVQRLVAELCLELLSGRDVVDQGVEADHSAALRRPDRELNGELVAVAMDGLQLHAPREDASVARRGVPAQALAVGRTLALRDDELRQLDADRLSARPSEGPLRLVVPVLDDPVAVDGNEGIARRLDDHALLLLAGDQGLLARAWRR